MVTWVTPGSATITYTASGYCPPAVATYTVTVLDTVTVNFVTNGVAGAHIFLFNGTGTDSAIQICGSNNGLWLTGTPAGGTWSTSVSMATISSGGQFTPNATSATNFASEVGAIGYTFTDGCGPHTKGKWVQVDEDSYTPVITGSTSVSRPATYVGYTVSFGQPQDPGQGFLYQTAWSVSGGGATIVGPTPHTNSYGLFVDMPSTGPVLITLIIQNTCGPNQVGTLTVN